MIEKAGARVPGSELLAADQQANLRTQYAVALYDLPRLLKSVNRLSYENTTGESHATMFFGVYEDARKTLRFANCGHVSPQVLAAYLNWIAHCLRTIPAEDSQYLCRMRGT